jgi:beta-glucosidase
VVFDALGDRAGAFITLNEPFIDLFLMDIVAENVRAGKVPPLAFTSAQFGRQAQAMHHLLSASARAVAAFRASGRAGLIGIALPLIPTVPFDADNAADVATAALADGVINRWPLDAAFRGTYPDDAIAALREHNPELDIPEADLAVMRDNPVDVLGVNFYAPSYVKHDDSYPLGFRWHDTNPDKVPAFNGPVRPEALHGLLLRIRDDYGNPPVVITENGAGFGAIDELRDGDAVHDPLRTDYIRRHIEATLQARDEGADVRGYMCWSLFDNFEWIQGYERRFGMVFVDFDSLERIPKDSFHAYKALIARERGR